MSAGPLQWMVEEGHTEQGVGVDQSISPVQWMKVYGVQQEDQDQTEKRTERMVRSHFLSISKDTALTILALSIIVMNYFFKTHIMHENHFQHPLLPSRL